MDSNPAINMASPVNWANSLNNELRLWLLVMPGTNSGSRWMDLTDPGPSGNHGTLNNMGNEDWIGSFRPGGWGGLDFDGSNDDVQVTASQAINNLFPMTWNLWVQKRTFPQNTTRLMNKGTGDGFVFRNAGAQTNTVKFERSHTGANELVLVGPDEMIFTGVPTMLTITWDGGTAASGAHIYQDGLEVASYQETNNASGTPDDDSGTNLFIAESSAGGVNHDGFMDDIRVWARALTATEVFQYYNLSKVGYPGLLNTFKRRFVVAAAPGAGIRNPFGGPMVLRNPLGA